LKGRKSLRTPRCIWEDNIKIDPGEVEWEIVDWLSGSD
jgi:hypothetical protein